MISTSRNPASSRSSASRRSSTSSSKIMPSSSRSSYHSHSGKLSSERTSTTNSGIESGFLPATLQTCCRRRVYVDQIGHALSSLYGRSAEISDQVAKRRDAESEARLGYRVMEKIRNYVQHRSLPPSIRSPTATFRRKRRICAERRSSPILPWRSCVRILVSTGRSSRSLLNCPNRSL
jgi:hypothetical protein